MSIITLKGLVFLQTWQLLKELKLLNIRQSYKQEGDCLVHFLRLLAVCWQARKVHETTTFLLATCQIFTDLKKKNTNRLNSDGIYRQSLVWCH